MVARWHLAKAISSINEFEKLNACASDMSGLNANEIYIPHHKHHQVSSMVKSHQNTLNSVKYEVI